MPVRWTSAPPSYALAAKVYAHEWFAALDSPPGPMVASVATKATMQRTGLSETAVRLASRLAMELLREADEEFQREYREREPYVRTGVSGLPVRGLRRGQHPDRETIRQTVSE